MKNLITVVLLSIFVMSFKPQNDSTLLYQQSLQNHLANVKIDTVYILKCFDIELPSQVGVYTIVDISENTTSFLLNRTSLYAIKIMPLEIHNGSIEITLIDYVLKIDKGEIVMSNTGSIVFSYKYDSQTKKYKLLKKSRHTI